jgi:hypothetical protein
MKVWEILKSYDLIPKLRIFLNNFSSMVLTFKLLMVTLLYDNIYIIGQTCYYYGKSCGAHTNII